AFIDRGAPPGIKGGLALQAINPKAYVVGTSLFTGFPFENTPPSAEIIIKLLVLNAIWIPIHVLWLWAGVALRRLDLPPRKQRAINVGMALSMVMVVVLAALSA
ncbi:MAG: LysE family translocator, partial [Pikeienuella sp.]